MRVDDLPPCHACGGKVFPLVLCERCGAATILREAQTLDWATACRECGTFNPWQLICDECHTRFPAPVDPAGPPANSPPRDAAEETASVSAGRAKRRIKGDVDPHALIDLLKILGLDASRAQALIDRGYDALWKIARAKEDLLARIPEVGPIAARKMIASFHLLNYSPPKRTKESIAQDEYECPLCRCVTSAFALQCIECGGTFDEEEMEEDIRRSFAEEGDAALSAFYAGRLSEKPDDPELSYAQGLLLESLGRPDEAIAALDRATSKAPDSKKIRVAQLRLQAKHLQKPEVAAKLRSTASALLDDVAWEQEVAQLDQLISEAERACPHCGSMVPAEMALCPSCGMRLSVPAVPPPPKRPEPSATPELDALVDDLLVGELEESLTDDELERTKAAVLDWLIVELEESMAPDAQVVLPRAREESKKVPPEAMPISESIGFLSSWMRGSRGLVSGLRPKRGVARGGGKVNGLVNGKGRVNGLVNGVGRTNGLVNGMGRVNGLVQSAGRVNGLVTGQGRVNGLVVGEGRVNGLAPRTKFVRPSMRGLRLPYPSKKMRYMSVASGILVAILIAGFLFIPAPGPVAAITIDGSFDDWNSVSKFDAATPTANPDVSLDQYASLLERDNLYLFAATRGNMFGDPVNYHGVYFFIDGDGNATTGFSFDRIGADAVVTVFGANERVDGARMFSFPPASEVNWSQRQADGSAQAAASARGVEAHVSTFDIEGFSPTGFEVAVYVDDFGGGSSRSAAFLTAAKAAILLEVRPRTSLIGGGPTHLFDVQVRGLGFSVSSVSTVSNLTFVSTYGVNVSLSPESVTLTQGQPNATITASVSAPGFFPGDPVQVDLTSANASYPLVMRGGPVRAYVQSAPSTIRIDGLFADWIGRDNTDSDPVPIDDANVDIVRSGAAANPSTAFFHVAVAGNLLEGRVPERIVRSLPGTGGNGSGRPIPLPRMTGEDILRAYVDLNATDPLGAPVDGIYADYMLEVRGVGGRITGRTLFSWTGMWSPIPSASIALAKDTTEIEGSFPVASGTNTTRVVFEATDWSARVDLTSASGAPLFSPIRPASLGPDVLSAAPSLIIMSGTNFVKVTATALSSVPTVDGNCTTGEYTGAASADNANMTFFAGTFSQSSFAYFCVTVLADTTNNTGLDWGEMLFDANLTGGSSLDASDRLFRVSSGGGTFTQQKGAAGGWVTCDASCDGGNTASGAFDGTHQVYEFKIRFVDVWGSNNPSPNNVSGFAILAFNHSGSQTFTWGSGNILESNPSTWGQLEIPEFQDFLLVSVSVLVIIGMQLRRRRS